ncbi:hypothetical protein GMA3_47 [Gordonia phage GMA3]|uniref:Uncharacterized protein n=1 Tax=Gordonia phage GMA3 TaxID=1647284 RepID=A0A0K0NKW0_9CAUD|nr:hypothetical protein AU105_gp047 [Gordonia phage GMA3]AKL88224.1 hypothetical protein GMA3_47 [Gordonia phage GMA3]
MGNVYRDDSGYKAVIKVIKKSNGGKFEIEVNAPSVEKLNEKVAAHMALVDEDDFGQSPASAAREVLGIR